MLKKFPVLKWTLIVLSSIIVLLVLFGFWFMSLLPDRDPNIDHSKTLVNDLAYVVENPVPYRGKVLAVVTSVDKMGNTEKSTGYELTEISRAYYVFKANGFEVDIASPKGGEPPVVIDDEDMGPYDYAFLNDNNAQQKIKNSIAVADIDPSEYEAVYFAGGKGAMFDFPNNKAIQYIVKELYQSNKVVGAVCHGPAALVNVTLDNGMPLVKNKTVSGFTNEEELLLIPDAEEIFPFLLQDGLESKGAKFNAGAMYLEQISHDNNLITGQNPWSTWKMAETMVSQMGYTPKTRDITAIENAMQVMITYENHGKQAAKDMILSMSNTSDKPMARQLLAAHSVVSVMRGKLGRFANLVSLTSYAKSVANE